MMLGRRVMGTLAVLLVASMTALVPQVAFAATVTWDGETDSNWATATNWVGNVAPVTGDDVVLTDAGNAPTNNNLAGVQLHSVTISSVNPLDSHIGGNPIALEDGGSITLNYPDLLSVFFDSGVTLNGDAAITVSDGAADFDGAITGTGPLTLVNSDILSLNVANSYTGATTIDGTLSVFAGVNGAIPTGSAVTVNGMLNSNSAITIGSLAGGGRVNINFGNSLTVGGDNTDTTFSGIYQAGGGGANSLVKTGTGTLTLSGTSTFAGGTTIDDGTIVVSSDSNLGDVAGGLIFDGGTLRYDAGFSSARSVILNAGGGTIDTNGNNPTLSGVISGTGSLTKTGSGTIILSGASTYTGATTVSAGTLTVTGSTAAGTTITVESGATLDGTGTINGNVVLEDGATLGSGLTISGTVNPLADDQSVSTDEDTTLIITLTGSDGNSDPLTFFIQVQPENGTLALAGGNTTTSAGLTYTPDGNFSGSDSFTFIANDGGLDSPTATVSITINAVNDVPVANSQNVSTNEDTALPITLVGSDVEGSALTFLIQLQPENGTLATTNVNTTTTASLTYTPDGNFSGSDSFTFVANDGTVDSTAATILITINAADDLPAANAQSVATDEDDDVAITLTGSDAEGSPLTFAVLTQPASGTLTGTAPNLTYAPNAGFNGADSFTFVTNDGTSNSTAATVSITVNPVAEEEEESSSGGGGGGGGSRTVEITWPPSGTTTFPESHFADHPLDRVQVSNLGFIAAGVSITQGSVGQQISIAATLVNHQQEEQDYAFIIQITDEDGSVVHVSWQQGTIDSGQTVDVSTVWMPVEDGSYNVQIFVWDGLGASPAPLSQVTADNIEVTG